MILRDPSDIKALEARGLHGVFEHPTPLALLTAAATRAPDAPAIRFLRDAADPARDLTWSHGDLLDHVHAAAAVFRDHGVGPDDTVALLTVHSAMAQAALWGAELAGRACPINPMLQPDHIAALLDAAGAKLVVVTGVNPEADIWSALVPALRAAGVRLPILAVDGDAASPGADGELEALTADRRGVRLDPEGGPEETAAFYHTGGTTGAPKLVRHLRRNQAHVARGCALMFDMRPDDVVVNGFPLFHVAGAFVYGLSVLGAGGCLLIPGRLGMRNRAFTDTIWQQVARHRVTLMGTVPTVLSALRQVPVDADITPLRALLTGGSPLPPDLAAAVEAHTGKPVRNILGMTESAGTMAVEPLHGSRAPNSCGYGLPFTELAIFAETQDGADTRQPLPPGETGVIAQRGPNVAAGYTDPSLDRGTFTADGWLLSGDLGRIDANGRLFVTGRAKDIIIRGGHNIDPQRIEDALLSHPQVLDAAAVGMPDAHAGELPVAFVTLKPGASVDGQALIDDLRPRIEEPAALPRRIEVIEAMPLTPIGKIFKPALRRQATRWAILSAAEAAGLTLEPEAVAVEALPDVIVTLPQAQHDALRLALTGMPLTIDLRAP